MKFLKGAELALVHTCLAALTLATLMLMGCGETFTNRTGPAPQNTRPFDGVKLISRAIPDTVDVRTYSQPTYQVSESERVLIRYETLSQYTGKISTQAPVRVRLNFASEEDATRARVSLQLCPMTRDWMLAASWTRAHPYKDGQWSQPGGDFNSFDCVGADAPASTDGDPSTFADGVAPSTEVDKPISDEACQDAQSVCFTVTDWYRTYVVERGTNYGLILLSTDTTPIRFFGDAAGVRAPRILWAESPKALTANP